MNTNSTVFIIRLLQGSKSDAFFAFRIPDVVFQKKFSLDKTDEPHPRFSSAGVTY
jgi:hypothetical protein